MDSKKTLTQIAFNNRVFSSSLVPIIGIIMVLLVSVAFYLCHTHDQKVWQQLVAYHTTYLLNTEKPLYQDFYSKRLLIEKIGSENKLEAIQQSIQSDDKEQLTTLILSDRSFRIFLEQKAPIYFSPKNRADWLKHNQVIKDSLKQLSIYQFSILPERFKASPTIKNLLSYIFIDQKILNFLSNVLLLLLLCILIEPFVKKLYLIGFMIGFSIIYASLYITISHSYSTPLFGLNALIYILASLSLSVLAQKFYREKLNQLKYILVIGIVLFCFKIGLDFYFQTVSIESVYLLLPLCFVSILLAQTAFNFCRLTVHTSNEQAHIAALSESTRINYAEALKGLSRFNFNYARQKLRSLAETEPNSQQIIESSYHLEKLTPEEKRFGQLAQRRIDEALIKQDYVSMRSIFTDIQRSTPNRSSAKKHISPDSYLKMLVVFLQHNDIEKAEHAFMFLELAGKKTLVQEACKLLIDSFHKKKLVKKKEHYQALYQSLSH